MIRVGVAGWVYDDWKGPVYPAPAPKGFDPLAWLSGWFDLVEINSTFYRPASARVARSWLSRVEARPDFRFTAKVWRRFTHERTPFGAAEVAAAREGLDLLAGAGRLGAALLQFPWSFKRDEASREWLRVVAGALRGLPLVIEVRHASWNVPELYASLAAQGIGFVNLDQPIFRNSLAPSALATVAAPGLADDERMSKPRLERDALGERLGDAERGRRRGHGIDRVDGRNGQNLRRPPSR